ncbi:hypothetical protein [Glutamicibacter protophormiae]|uniref:hypothetical protein n=1 Tax=Glutamicibacter protophormiae TaxID=37930 RepID=UPI00361D6DBC
MRSTISTAGSTPASPLPGNKMIYGQIVFALHSELSSKIALRWGGEQMETKAHPEQIIRIEATP